MIIKKMHASEIKIKLAVVNNLFSLFSCFDVKVLNELCKM